MTAVVALALAAVGGCNLEVASPRDDDRSGRIVDRNGSSRAESPSHFEVSNSAAKSARLDWRGPVAAPAQAARVGLTGPTFEGLFDVPEPRPASALASAEARHAPVGLSAVRREPGFDIPPGSTAERIAEAFDVPTPVLFARPPLPLRLARAEPATLGEPFGESAARPDRRSIGALRSFHAALRDLESGVRTRPLRILHMGDSHIASDLFPDALRRRLQERFGDAGRGLMQPPKAFRWHRVAGMETSASDGWHFANSLTEKSGAYGLTGVRATSDRDGAVLAIDAKGERFERASVHYLRRPGGGRFEVTLGGAGASVATSDGDGPVGIVSVEGSSSLLKLRTLGGGPVTVLGWSLEKARAGIQYVNLGIPGAAVYSARVWTPEVIAADVRALEPDLVILGYGSNDAFNSGLSREGYEGHVRHLLDQLVAAAPQASVLVLGPPDGARRAGSGPHAESRCPSRVGGTWHPLPRMGLVREVLRQVARDLDAAYWDWADAMGGACSIGQWASLNPPLAARDHLHLTTAGYQRSAAALFGHLMRGYEASQVVAYGAD